jgi:hypothetical protein
MWIKSKCDDFLITGKGFGTVEDLLVPFMDAIKISYYNDAHMLIISDSLNPRVNSLPQIPQLV